MAVVELGKPNYTTCPNECSHGCAIYAHRPNACRTFVCLWKLPNWILSDEDRPDKLGVIFFVRMTGERQQLVLWELWAGAAQQPRIAEILRRIDADPVIVSPPSWTIIV